MAAKISALVTLALSATSFLTWGAVEANNKYQYNSKMKEYEKYWEEFVKKALEDNYLKSQLCSSYMKCGNNKSYLPKPDEYKYWQESYKSLEFNGKNSLNIEDLKNVKSPEQLIDYCYLEVKKELSNNLSNTNSSSGWFTHCPIIPKTQ